ncbi:MAG: DUF561 domain-containing protein [Bacillota bacterium]|nr:DUF561 domain-containing protein [Bacillota bacterium]
MLLNEILGIKYPFIQGAMARISSGAFAAAASNSGGLGVIAAGGTDVDGLRREIRMCRSLTDRVFGVNIMLMHPRAQDMAEVSAEEKVPVITTGAGNPAPYISMWHEVGSKVFPVIPSVALAKRMEKFGADGVIAEGTESGGHVGELTTMALVYQVVQSVNIPVVAAGGIASGSQYLAALALGAVGAQIGTCLLATEECPIHDNYKQALLRAKDIDTVVTGRITGTPVRILKNAMAREYLRREAAGATREELEKYTLNSLSKAVEEGDVKNGSLMAGQVSGQIKEIKTIAQVFEDIYSQSQDRFQVLKEELV